MDVSVRISYLFNALRIKAAYIDGVFNATGDLIFYGFYPKEDESDEKEEEQIAEKADESVAAPQPKVDTEENREEHIEEPSGAVAGDSDKGSKGLFADTENKADDKKSSGFTSDKGDSKSGERDYSKIFEKAIGAIKGLYGRLVKAFADIKESFEKYTDDVAKEAYSHVLTELVVLLRHMRLRHGHIDFTLGFEDPSVTGQLLAFYSLVYPKVHKRLVFSPDFEKKIYKGSGKASGRIIPAVLLGIAIRLFFDKNIRHFIDRR